MIKQTSKKLKPQASPRKKKPSTKIRLSLNPNDESVEEGDLDFTKYKKTPTLVNKLLECFKQGATYKLAAKACGIRKGTLYRWRMEDPKFDALIENAKCSRVRVAEDALFKNVTTGNVEAQKFFLKNKGLKKGDWKDKQEHEHTGDVSILMGHRKKRKGNEE